MDAAKILKEREINDICFVFAGYGAEESKLKSLAEKHQLNNVLFTGKHNTFVISELVNCCDASLVSVKNLPIMKHNSANKLFDSFSAGKPLIINYEGWTKKLLEETVSGFYVDPENPGDLVDKLIKVKNDEERLNKMGENARRLSLEVFNKEILSEKLVTLLESLPAKKLGI
jgi:glycosyltransferase involved in cell wall biosynthesis